MQQSPKMTHITEVMRPEDASCESPIAGLYATEPEDDAHYREVMRPEDASCEPPIAGLDAAEPEGDARYTRTYHPMWDIF
ncbi:hypothetical protein J6590_012669 [Homalodisca vitripennis]|nr:hypothetical protein J6590_012669 [Homalodisca vitripennis]